MQRNESPPQTRRGLRQRRDEDNLFSFAPANAMADEQHGPATILMVCTGNICRSALAEALLRARLADLDVQVRSAGTHALVGHGMPEEARELTVRFGGDVEAAAAYAGRLLDERLLREADLVLTMTAEHSAYAVQLAPTRLRQVFPVRTFARLAATVPEAEVRHAADDAGGNPRARLRAAAHAVAARRGTVPRTGDEDVIDPFRRGMAVYEQAAEQLLPALDEVERVVRAAQLTG